MFFCFVYIIRPKTTILVIGNDERTLVTVDYGGPQTHRPTTYHDDHSKIFPNFHDPHTHPPPGPSYDDSLNLSGTL